jgi:hypothetical protein
MKFSDFSHRMVSFIVLIAFIALLQGGPAPAQTTAAPDDSRPGMEQGNGDTPGSFEAEQEAPAVVKKHKKFPWLIAALGAVAVGVAVYFLVIKKTKYTLTVHVGPGATGIPLSTAVYKKGEAVPYRYEALHGYSGLTVTLDGVEMPVHGRITMDKDHALVASASADPAINPPTLATLVVNAAGIGGEIYLDGKDTMFFTPYTFTFPTAVTKSVLVRQCYRQEWLRPEVHVALGEKVILNVELEEGIRDDFVAEDFFPCWIFRDPSALWLGSGVLKAAAPRRGYQYALYDISSYYNWPDYTISTRLRIVSHLTEKFGQTAGIVLATTNDMAASRGYEFSFFGDRRYVIYKNNRYNHLYDTGNWRYIKAPTPCTPRDFAPGAWNTIKIVKAGGNYTFYVNDSFVYSFFNDDYAVRFPSLVVFGRGVEVEFDWIWLQPGVTAGSVPGAKLEEGPEMEGARGKES